MKIRTPPPLILHPVAPVAMAGIWWWGGGCFGVGGGDRDGGWVGVEGGGGSGKVGVVGIGGAGGVWWVMPVLV